MLASALLELGVTSFELGRESKQTSIELVHLVMQLETVLLRHRPREVVWPKDATGLPMLSKPALKVHTPSSPGPF